MNRQTGQKRPDRPSKNQFLQTLGISLPGVSFFAEKREVSYV
jgi:hypothetical protein